LAVCYTLFVSGSDSWETNNVTLELQQELRKAAEWLKQDLVQGGASTITDVPADGAWYTAITFRTCAGISNGNIAWSSNTVNFARSGTQLVRTSGSSTRTLAQNIGTLQFKRDVGSPQVVYVNLQASKTAKGRSLTADSGFKVTLRN